MDLSPEDALRLNVLLANKPQAIRIHESSMTVFGLSEKGEAAVKLNPNCRDEQYVKRVKELLSGHVMGSPGGYPVYLQRWTRMGQMRDDNLEQLLLLGEPEAVVATVGAQGLSDELARRAWWAMEDAENARQMLKKSAVVEGKMGPVLAEYLVEHLPFETEAEKQIETILLVLQPGLMQTEQISALWRKAQRKPSYYVGFIASLPDDIPDEVPAHGTLDQRGEFLESLASKDNPVAKALLRVLSPAGQAFLSTVHKIFKKPANQEVVNSTLDCIAGYFSPIRPEGYVDATLEELSEEAEAWFQANQDIAEIVQQIPELSDQLKAMRVLSGLSYGVVRPVFKGTTAIGSLMRRKLEPVMEPLSQQLACLAGSKFH